MTDIPIFPDSNIPSYLDYSVDSKGNHKSDVEIVHLAREVLSNTTRQGLIDIIIFEFSMADIATFAKDESTGEWYE